MNKCECGHEHCCHETRKTEIIKTENEYGNTIIFKRTSCLDCTSWLSDEPIGI